MEMIRRLLVLVPLLAFGVGARAQDLYAGIGLPGLGTLGYAHALRLDWGLRAESSQGAFSASGIANAIGGLFTGYDYSEGYTRHGVFADWFAFEGGLRLVGGLTFNDIWERYTFTGNGLFPAIGGKVVNMSGQHFNIEFRQPALTPYLGVGYGHHFSSKGLGFYADFGVTIGSYQSLVNTSLVASGQLTQAEVDAEVNRLGSNGLYHPSLSFGMLYRF